MIPYSIKIQAAVKDMLINPEIAKAPRKESSLSIPSNISATITRGNIKESEVGYRITAINKYGETSASDEFSMTIGTILDNVNVINSVYTPGILTRGIYYYGVTATNESGETNVLNSYYVNNPGAPAPDWAVNPAIVTEDGMLPIGTYFYSIVSVIDNKETNLSNFQEVQVEKENSSVNLKFLAVEGASAYNIYGRDRNMPKRIGSIPAGVYTGPDQVIEFKDNGTSIGKESAPTFNNTTAGIEIQWEAIEGNVKTYKIYGRTSPIANELRFIAEVPNNVTSYKDSGFITPTYTPPIRNTSGYSSGSGVVLKWNPVPSATGYRIYGRKKAYENEEQDIVEEKGYLTTIPDPSITTWTDTGVITPDLTISYPTADSTDGTKGVLGSVIPDGVTLDIDENGLLSVKGGIDSFLGNSLITNLNDQDVLVFDYKKQKWVNFDLSDLIFTLISITDDTVVPKDEKFTAYKENLINTLNTLNTFKEDYNKLVHKVKYLENCIASIKRDIGTSFFPELQDVEEILPPDTIPPEEEPEPQEEVTQLTVTPETVTLNEGAEQVLTINTEAKTFDITSKKKEVCTTNKASKKITAKKAGSTTVVITAKAENKKAKTIEIPVVVKAPKVLIDGKTELEWTKGTGETVVHNEVTYEGGATAYNFTVNNTEQLEYNKDTRTITTKGTLEQGTKYTITLKPLKDGTPSEENVTTLTIIGS